MFDVGPRYKVASGRMRRGIRRKTSTSDLFKTQYCDTSETIVQESGRNYETLERRGHERLEGRRLETMKYNSRCLKRAQNVSKD